MENVFTILPRHFEKSTRNIVPEYELAVDICRVVGSTNVKRFLKYTYQSMTAARRAMDCLKGRSGVRNKEKYFTAMFKLYNE